MKLLDLLAAIIQNLSSHPDNRTQMYRAELAGTAALDRVLEGPESPEPTETSAALLATRLTGHLNNGTNSPVRAGSPAADRTSSPQRSQSPGGQVDTVLAAAGVLRPKVVFPSITRAAAVSGEGADYARASSPSSPTATSTMWPGSPSAASQAAPGSPAAAGKPSVVPPRTAPSRGSPGNRNLRSRGAASSVAGIPGSPMAAPDSKEQFMIWMDSTFFYINEGSQADAEGFYKEKK